MYRATIQRSIVGAVIFATLALGGVAYAESYVESEEKLRVSASGMTATAVLHRSTPCTSYELVWGDGEEEVVEDEAEVCVQVIDRVTLSHEYEEEGDYTITLALQGKVHEAEVSIPAEVVSFDLDDVETITSIWVDPSEQMADEEYYIYTVTLENGDEIEVQAGGFTTQEYRNEQFEQAGYTGDVDALLAMVEQEDDEQATTTPPVEDDDNLGVYQQLIQALETLIERMQMLLQLR